MNKFIGQYLIEKNYASSSDVLDALAKELSQQPSVIQVLRDLNALNDEQILKVVADSSTHQKSILSLIKEQNLLSNEKLNEVITTKLKKGPTYLDILVKEGKIASTDLASIIESFRTGETAAYNSPEAVPEAGDQGEEDLEVSLAALESLKELGIATDEQLAMLESKLESSDEDNELSPEPELESSASDNNQEEIGSESGDDTGEEEVSLAALESLKELGIATEEQLAMLESHLEKPASAPEAEAEAEVEIEVEVISEEKTDSPSTIDASAVNHSPFVDEFLNQYDDFTYDELINICKNLVNGLNKDKISEAHEYFTGLTGAAKLAEFKYLVKLFQGWNKIFESILENQIDFSSVNFLKISGTLKKSIKISKSIRDIVEKEGSEEAYFTDIEAKKSYLENMKAILEFLGTKK